MAAPWLVLAFVGIVLEDILYGIYCVIFSLYLGIQLKRPNPYKSVLLYALTVNFILCTVYCVLGAVQFRFYIIWDEGQGNPSVWDFMFWLNTAGNALYTAIDLTSQLILFYRCWILWRQPWVLVVPGFFSLSFLATALTTLGFSIAAPGHDRQEGPHLPVWYSSAVVAFFALSLVANALLTGLIVYKIIGIYRDIQGFSGETHTDCDGRGPRDLYPLISILAESGMITFVAQLLQTSMYKTTFDGFRIVNGSVVMLYGISTAIVLVRVEMGVSYDRHTSTSGTANLSRPIHFAPFASNNNNPTNIDVQTTINITGGDREDSYSGSGMKLMRNV